MGIVDTSGQGWLWLLITLLTRLLRRGTERIAGRFCMIPNSFSEAKYSHALSIKFEIQHRTVHHSVLRLDG